MKNTRAAEDIKQDMLEWAKENLYARLGEEWDYNGRDFDPLVHLLVGACASEVKNIFDALDSSERRVVKKLAELILPDEAHLASPARGLASVTPTGSSAYLSETTQFRCDTEAGTFYFTPAFNCHLLNSELKVVGSDGLIFEYKAGKEKPSGQYTHVSKILLGFEAPKPIISFDNILFYFNLLGQNNQLLFLNAVAEGSWKINGQPVKKTRGFRQGKGPLERQYDMGFQPLQQIADTYQSYFFTTQEYIENALLKRNISEVVVSWLRENHTDTPTLEEQAQALSPVEDNIFWLEIQLPYPVRVFEFEKNFRCATNILPIVNRQLHVKDDADTFLNRPVVDVLCITPEKQFLGVHQVENLQNREVIPLLPFSKFKGSRTPAYSVRYGGVGRTDNYNAWSRLSYLLGLFREEHRYREVLERIGDKISIEELHLLIGEKILRDEPQELNPENNIYFFLHPGENLKGGIRARISYWTTDGAKANRIPVPKGLICDPPDPSIRKEGTTLITPLTGGKDMPNETEYYALLRHNLLKKEQLVTSKDVEYFCHHYVGEKLRQVEVKPGFRVDPTPQGGINRVSEVLLQVDNPEDHTWEGACRELEYLLNQKSSGVIPYAVTLTLNGHA
ncbi:hypothetical protein [Sabulibacter ruber]|uniref:hypothetical protein n=1 Tax=Sabulibacter ruber TaxID=2811901 RepID=UPI001A97BDD6|nr:hypothetical protein [Sabulibacter ruber]